MPADADTTTYSPSFSLEDAAMIVAWSAEHCPGLRVRLALDHEEFAEVAEVYHTDPNRPLWLLAPIRHGYFELTHCDTGRGWKVPSVDAALGVIEATEACEGWRSSRVAPTRALGR